MNRFFGILFAIFLLCISGNVQANMGIQVGGGMFFNNNGDLFGVALEKDFSIVSNILEFSPFIDILRGSAKYDIGFDYILGTDTPRQATATTTLYHIGSNFILNFLTSQKPDVVYMGLGFGLAREASVYNGPSQSPEDYGSTKFAIDAIFGFEAHLQKNFSVFLQGKWLYIVSVDNFVDSFSDYTTVRHTRGEGYLGNFIFSIGIIL